jgi:MFS family permease
MTLLDIPIVNVALPSIQRGLDASPQGVQRIVSGYALTFGVTLVAGGRPGDVIGRRRMFAARARRVRALSCCKGLPPGC